MKPLYVFVALFAFTFLPLYAASLDDLTYRTTDGKVTITACDEAATGELVIPATIGGKPVTSIGEEAFAFCESLTSITIPDSVTSIDTFTFWSCTSLTSITIPDSVTTIGEFAFFLCTSLTNITIPDSVTRIGMSAFERCPAAIEVRPVTQNQLAAQLAAVTAERDAAIAERDARPTADQLAAVEAERDARPTADQLAAVVAERDARPTTDQLAAAEAERDARPTAEALATVGAERDAILNDIQLAYDEVVGRKGAAEVDLIAVAPTSSATIFDLVWTNSGDPADTIEMTIEFPEGTIANPVEFDFDTTIQGSVLTIDYQGTVTVINDASIAFESPVALDFSQELMGQNGFGATAGVEGSGDFNLFGAEVPEGLFSGQNYFTLGAPDGSLYTLTSMLAPVTSRFSSLELNPLTELYSSLTATNEATIAERDAAIAERDARFFDTDKDGITDAKEAELETDSAEETIFYLQDAYDSAVNASRLSGRNEVTTSPAVYQLISISTYNTAIAERDARPTAEQLAAVVAERNARPTEEAYNALIAERDARPTIEEVKDARLGSVLLQPDVANQSVKIRFSIEETDDFRTWTKRDEINEVTVPLEVGKRFYRFALEDE